MNTNIHGNGRKSRKKFGKNHSISLRRIDAESSRRKNITPYGGLSLAHGALKALHLSTSINTRLNLFSEYHEYVESDHIYTPMLTLFTGGECVSDSRNLSGSEATRNLFYTDRFPHPSTTGEFLERFSGEDIETFQDIQLDAIRRVWAGCGEVADGLTIDTDSVMKELTGDCFEKADFSWDRKFGYSVECVTADEPGEVMATQLFSGSHKSGVGAEDLLERVYSKVAFPGRKIRHRGDSKYSKKKIIKKDEEYNVEFVLGYESCAALRDSAEELPEEDWEEMPLNPALERKKGKNFQRKTRKKLPRVRKKCVKKREYKNMQKVSRAVSQIRYTPTWSEKSYRILVIRSRVEVTKGSMFLYDMYDYMFLITNDEETPAGELVDFYYRRGDQENVFRQFKQELKALWMPSHRFMANQAWTSIAALAWNVKCWIAHMGLAEARRWNWKRFRYNMVYLPAIVKKKSGRVKMIFDSGHAYTEELLRVLECIYAFSPP